MPDFDLDRMLFYLSADQHEPCDLIRILRGHPEIRFVSFVGIDIGGHDTDEKIPVKLFLENAGRLLKYGVHTDGSSVALPGIASLNDAKVDIIPDMDVNWYVDHNFNYIQRSTGLPTGTLRIPSFLVHNGEFRCGSRSILRNAVEYFKRELMKALREHPYVFRHLEGGISADDMEDLTLTSATELEFWVKTPYDKGDTEELFTSQVLKEQYWKRTYGEVRTAFEETLTVLDKYGFDVEMGHKEVGGVKAKMGRDGHYDHVMEQLEIDWKYAGAIQAADNENQVKYVVRDIFTMHGLDVTFMAKPFEGVIGSGEHTHLGLAAKLKSGKRISLLSPWDSGKDFLSPIGYGGLMGLLKNYEVINPFVSSTNDAFNRLKPGFEAPVCIVTSLGKSAAKPSRNRTVLAGLIKDPHNPLATRFELRSPNPKSNTYLVLAASYMAVLDGIKAVLEGEKTPGELERSICKKYGEEDFYLERNREYRTEEDVFLAFTDEERSKLFGEAPATVWENLLSFEKYPEKTEIFSRGNVLPPILLGSYRQQMLGQWKTELHDRIIPEAADYVRSCRKLHGGEGSNGYDEENWLGIDKIRRDIAKDAVCEKCCLTRLKEALDKGEYQAASALQKEIRAKIHLLTALYAKYKKNLL